MREKKKNPESIALANKTVDFIAPAAFFKDKKGVLPNTIVSPQSPSPTTPSPPTELKITAITTEPTIAEPLTETIKVKEVVTEPAIIPQEHLPETAIVTAPIVDQADPQEIVPTQEPIEAPITVTDSPEEVSVAQHSTVVEPIVQQTPTAANTLEIPEAAETLAVAEEKIELKTPVKRVSGLSISSLKAKKEHQLQKKDEVIDQENLPREPFTQEVMQKHWDEFVKTIDAKGQKILASNLATDVPKLLKDHVIWIELPNGTMKKEVEREQFDLMEHLRSNLNNRFIELKITVNEETAKKFAFTPEEKYEKLREKNPAIDLLRQEFDLDL